MHQKLILLVSIVIAVYACNKIEPKKFHENTCESVGVALDTAVFDSDTFVMSATINTQTELWLRLEGDTVVNFDSLVSHWIQIKSSDDCYQANTFKRRTELGETYMVVDYIIPTFIQKGYPIVWKLTYKNEDYLLKSMLQ
ncbi:MAG: hypothetical protein GC180_10625 [Bacteroidetes bacterium]|nr:hypothetical protein [Bacteroidota bacterium]